MALKLQRLIILIFLSQIGQAQNLVLNPSFELYTCSPWYLSSIENCNDWSSPTMSSPDYFNNTCLAYKTASVPQKYWGFQLPKSGNSYVGVIAYDFRKFNADEAGSKDIPDPRDYAYYFIDEIKIIPKNRRRD